MERKLGEISAKSIFFLCKVQENSFTILHCNCKPSIYWIQINFCLPQFQLRRGTSKTPHLLNQLHQITISIFFQWFIKELSVELNSVIYRLLSRFWILLICSLMSLHCCTSLCELDYVKTQLDNLMVFGKLMTFQQFFI